LKTTPLIAAIERKDAGLVERLLAGGADPNEPDPGPARRSALGIAARLGLGPIIRLLVARGADPARADAQGGTPLVDATRAGRAAAVAALLEASAPVDAADQHGQTALHAAVEGRLGKVVAALLAAGAKPDVGSFDPAYGVAGRPTYTPLHHAVLSEYVDIASALLAAGASADTGRAGARWTLNPLGMAIRRRNRRLVRGLAAAKASTSWLTAEEQALLPELLACAPTIAIDIDAALAAPDQVLRLELPGQGLTKLPDAVGRCRQLRALWLGVNRWRGLPASLGQLGELDEVSLRGCGFTKLPLDVSAVEGWRRLRWLDLRGNKLKKRDVEALRRALPQASVLVTDADAEVAPAGCPWRWP
jgi:hypothetical protein